MDDLHRTNVTTRLFRFIRRHFLWLAIVLFVAWTAAFFELGRYSVYRAYPTLESQQQATEILHKVGRLIQLPPDETPTMATINDAGIAKQGQPFLASAANGDVLIIYADAGEALLYRPSTDRLIAVGPVDTSASQAQAAETPVPQVIATSTDATDTPSRK